MKRGDLIREISKAAGRPGDPDPTAPRDRAEGQLENPPGVRGAAGQEVVDLSVRKTYRATAERDGRFWLLDVPEIKRVTQARRLDQAELMVRSLISIMTGEPEASFDVEIRPQLESALSDVVLRALAAKGRAAAAQAEASNLQREAARSLTESGMTIRDAGDVLGITHQRVAQLLASKPERPSAATLAASRATTTGRSMSIPSAAGTAARLPGRSSRRFVRQAVSDE